MIFWLVLIVAGISGPYAPRMMHVGNFSSYADCEKFAAGYTTPVKVRPESTTDHHAVNPGESGWNAVAGLLNRPWRYHEASKPRWS